MPTHLTQETAGSNSSVCAVRQLQHDHNPPKAPNIKCPTAPFATAPTPIDHCMMFEQGKDVDARASASLLDSEQSEYGAVSDRRPALHGDNDAQAKVMIITKELSTTQLAIVLGSTYLGIILAAFDGTMVSTSTASISASYNSFTLLSWLASAYYMPNAVSQPLAGKLTDIHGRRAGLVLCDMLFCVEILSVVPKLEK